MKIKTAFTLLMIGILFACQNQTSSDSKDNDYSQESILKDKIKQDSLRLVEQKRLEDEVKELENMEALGKWRCDFSGYESEIILYKEDNKFYSQIDFTKSNMKTKTEKLRKQGDKFYVIDSKAKKYYEIRFDGNLELGDQKGLFTNAVNIMPGVKVKDLPPFEISEATKRDEEAKALKEAKYKIQKLLNELLSFKDKSDFHKYGFGEGYKYNRWLKDVQNLKNTQAEELLLKKGFVPGDLEMLGLEYVTSNGRETEYSAWAKKTIRDGVKK